MNTQQIQSKYRLIGARARIRPPQHDRWRQPAGPVVIDIGNDRQGEFFDIQAEPDADVIVLDVQRAERHLLLMVRQPAERNGLPDVKDKFLCGHDERHWFVAGVPERAAVSSVVTAKESLKPPAVRELERGRKGKRAKRNRRKTDVFVRQGEWFFLPAADIAVPEHLVLRNEPITRGNGSKPHVCEFLYRDGGINVHVCRQHPDGLAEEHYLKLLKQRPAAAKWNWRIMRRNPVVMVRGSVSHADHATIRLNGWHRVEMNTENQSRAMAHVAFLD